MTDLSAANKSRMYNELTEATSPMTAEAIMHSTVDISWDDLVTKDHIEARFAQVDARFTQIEAKMDTGFARLDAKMDAGFARSDARLERAMRQQNIWLMSAMFTFNGLLAAWITAFH